MRACRFRGEKVKITRKIGNDNGILKPSDTNKHLIQISSQSDVVHASAGSGIPDLGVLITADGDELAAVRAPCKLWAKKKKT
jgi:hypothetical protein